MDADVPAPLLPLIVLDEGRPHLSGLRCSSCGAVFVDRRRHCAACWARDVLVAHRLSERGRLHAFSIVHRSFPGVPVPYVSAVVDLEGGGTLKGNLVGVEPDPAHVEVGMPVRVAFRATEQRDEDGKAYLCWVFEP